MSEPVKYRLRKDVVSYFAPYEAYGKAGTEVIILHDHFDMMVVVDAAGNIFHSRTDNLALLSEPIETAATVLPIENKIPGRTQKKKGAPITQTNMF